MKIPRALLLALCLLGIASFAFAQTPLTPEIEVNAADSGVKRDVAMNARGEFVVLWAGLQPAPPGESRPALFARWFAADGTPETGAILVSEELASAYDQSAVAIREDGSFLVLHHRRDPDGVERLKGRLVAPDGTPLGDLFPVANTRVGVLSVASREDGGFIVAWSDQRNRIVYRRLDSEGEPAGPERRLGTGSGVSVAAGPGNEMVLVWSDWSPDDFFLQAVAAQRLRPNGTRRGQKFLVSQRRRAQIYLARAAFDGEGNFLVLWLDRGTRARLYSRQGTALSKIHQLLPRFALDGIAMDRQGDFVLAWGEGREEGAVELLVRRFQEDGPPLGPALSVDSAELIQDLAIAGNEAGRFVLVWSEGGPLRAKVFSAE